MSRFASIGHFFTRKPRTDEELRELQEAAVAKEHLRRLKSGGRPGSGGMVQLERLRDARRED